LSKNPKISVALERPSDGIIGSTLYLYDVDYPEEGEYQCSVENKTKQVNN